MAAGRSTLIMHVDRYRHRGRFQLLRELHGHSSGPLQGGPVCEQSARLDYLSHHTQAGIILSQLNRALGACGRMLSSITAADTASDRQTYCRSPLEYRPLRG
jgi:hypothetical protein